MGHSIGGVTALLSASKFYKKIKAIVSTSAFVDAKRLIELNQGKDQVIVDKDYFNLWDLKVTVKHFEDKLYKNNKKMFSQVKCPALIIHSDQDETVYVNDAQTIYDLLSQPKDLKIIKSADHNFTNQTHLDEVINLIINWFKKYLIK